MARKHLLAQGFSSQLATPDRAAGGAYCGGHHVQCCGCDLQRWRRPPLPSTTHVPVCDLPGCPFSLGQRPRQCTVATRGLTPSDGLLGSLQCPAAKTHAASSEVSPRHPGEVSRSMTAVSRAQHTHMGRTRARHTCAHTASHEASPQHICCSYTQLYAVRGLLTFSGQPLLINTLEDERVACWQVLSIPCCLCV